ncbi:histidinol-phosphate transaminase [Halodesulfurarchaeum sp. HSR-GB]|uniref:histidinol-phosphate transaminase n=1 Tax=Halodesulfurarchaeum sp. HSR-GB TaxID=3074077 RepID=UPI00285D9415|nr:histidinol-phosphate transaminase [Halodesulfurarchaeum sp. HSR-GB]MDR5657336.1 histidinol-phosphate transaminase [Halodesulfurarchaeum sp. HSR-GB]
MEPRDLSDHTEYVAGQGIEEVARELGREPDELVKLASNENPHGPSPAAVEAIRDLAPAVHHYPKSAHTDLTAALAEKWDVEPPQIWLSPGGDGALDYLARAMLEPGDAVLVPDPGFAYYEMSARFHHGTVNRYEIDGEDFSLTPETVLNGYDGERIVYLTSPHNPTGSRFSVAAIREIADRTDEDTLLVVDEAYGEFATGTSARTLLTDREDIAVLRTFSKAYGLAGLRLGYAIVPEAWASAYARVNTPFAASSIACHAGLAALEDDRHVDRTVETVEWARAYMRAEIDAPVHESHGNFVMVEVGDGTAVADELRERGIIIRDLTSFGLPEYVRITAGTESETKQAVSALNEVLTT